MSIPLHPGTYRLEWNITTSGSPGIPGDSTKDHAWVANASALIGPNGTVGNVSAQTLGTGGLSGWTHRLIAIVSLSRQTNLDVLDTAAVNAYKGAYDRGISTTQIVREMNASSLSAFPFGVFSQYKAASHTYSGASPSSSAAPQYSIVERILQPTISSSTDEATVGEHPPSIDVLSNVKNALGSLSDAATIPLGYKIAGAAIVTLAAMAVVGYSIRSVR